MPGTPRLSSESALEILLMMCLRRGVWRSDCQILRWISMNRCVFGPLRTHATSYLGGLHTLHAQRVVR